ncbi:MAG: tetratricopeptide repeat protein [Candidatus Cyclobacteriaceae bacterium M3_2C_046]
MLITKKLTSTILFLICLIPAYSQTANDDIALANEYYFNGELEKAKVIYEDLIKKPQNIPLVHNNYYNLLLNTAAYTEAEKYIQRLLKKYPDHIPYQIDMGRIYVRKNDKAAEETYFNNLIEKNKTDQNKLRITAQYLINNQLMEYAVKAYQLGRRHSKDPLAFALELANTYRIINKRDQMIQEYLNFSQQNPSHVNYVKNVLQNILTEEGDLTSLESLLIEKVQNEPDNEIYSELLIWVNLQQKNFYGAFIQARAYDKRKKSNGSEVMDVGIITLKNKDYNTAIKIFEYIIEEYPKTINYPMAKNYIIKSREELIKNIFPIEKSEIRNLIADYQYLIDEIGVNNTTLEAMRSKAMLHAFYLDEFDSAIAILEKILQVPRINSNLRSQCKIDLGDIYLLTDQPWESTLLYSQVEKSQKETPIGYEAKLKNAKLSFYKGEFELAQEHLDILKLATTREIANDAMSLSLLIQDNSMMDSTYAALQDYASIELLLFRNKKDTALDSLQWMLKEYSGHSITDEVFWLIGKIYMELGEFDLSLSYLNKIVNEYQHDILSDDAYFMIGKIYEEQLKDKTKAMEIYQDFLKRYPGSLFTSEARKRFRNLRGDFLNP